ncbi:MAG: Mur ligase family protein [Bacteroidota bacterium]
MKIHFIAVGGSIMHSLAIALHQMGHEVSGSDDHIYDPASSNLAAHGLLPERFGWHPEQITGDIDAIILGMHAFEDNPELHRANELGLNIYSFPEFIFEHSKQKQRIAIAGSYGKTTVTSMVMHVLKGAGKKFDYLVGGQVPGFENSVQLSEEAPIIVLEGDEYLSSRIDKRPKFLLYKPHMVTLSGISWDHINVFPTEEEYVEQFRLLIRSLSKAADIIYCESDERLNTLIQEETDPELHYLHPFSHPSYLITEGKYTVEIEGEKGEVSVIGKHNMANLLSAWKVCQLLGVEAQEFLSHIQSFIGAHSRLEVLQESSGEVVIRDYAHAPAKVQASVEAVRERFQDHNLIACVELHTFSSLNKDFLPMYQNTLGPADRKIIFVDPHALEKRRMPMISHQDLQEAFGDHELLYVNSPTELQEVIDQSLSGKDVLLMMSSGNFGGVNMDSLLNGNG